MAVRTTRKPISPRFVVAISIIMAIIALSLPRGVRSEHHYGRWDRLVV
jgi:hypothetical protein